MKIFQDRNAMIASLPKGIKFVELGVYKGDFAGIIYDTVQPQELILIDCWHDHIIQSGDADGNNIDYLNGEQLYQSVLKKFKEKPNVVVVKALTDAIKNFPDSYFDAAYIDADHSYKAVYSDLNNCYDKVKNGGFIMGHDYEVNTAKAKNHFNFGVKEAVAKFCAEKGQELYAKAMDGMVGFMIQVKK